MGYDLKDFRSDDESVENWGIYCDMPMTRRKHFHVVGDPTGKPRYKSRSFTDCARFLADNGITEYWLHYFTDETLPSVHVKAAQDRS